jgi:hypothetical protein
MKNILLIIGILIFHQADAQPYKWDWVTGGGTCRIGPMPYYTSSDPSNIGFARPAFVQADHAGNVYVMGYYPNTDGWNKQYTVGSMTNLGRSTKPINGSTEGTVIYLYCIKADGIISWAHTISYSENKFFAETNDVTIVVNPFSGKVYLMMSALDGFYLGQDAVNTKLKDPVRQQRMLVSFLPNGTYGNTIFTGGVLQNLVFASADYGVFTASGPSDFPPYYDSTYQYLLNASTDVIDGRVPIENNKNQHMKAYNPVKQVFVSNFLNEYDWNMNLVKNVNYTGTTAGGNKTLTDVYLDKKGNYYLRYKYALNDPFTKYYIFKIKPDLTTAWFSNAGDFFQLDSAGNPWRFYNSHYEAHILNGNELQRKQFSANDSKNIQSQNFAIQFDPETGEATQNMIVPTNLHNQSFQNAAFIINNNNDFIFSGNLIVEAEFGHQTFSQICNNGTVPLQHYVAKASEGWQSTRKNLSALETLKKQWSIYPNPGNHYAQINIPADMQVQEAALWDMLGRKQEIRIDMASDKITFDTENLPTGVYQIVLKANNETIILKWIKP